MANLDSIKVLHSITTDALPVIILLISDTIVFIPHAILIPTVAIDNFLHQAASDIINMLTQPPPLLPTIYQLGNKTRDGLLQ